MDLMTLAALIFLSIVTNLKKMYNGAQAASYRVIWPYIYRGNYPQCNISSGSCIAPGSYTLILTPSGLIENRPGTVQNNGPFSPASSSSAQTFYHWTK